MLQLQRYIVLVCIAVVLTFPSIADALPGRDKNPLKFATVLPTRLIDSIMAQGNWNLLFQEGPFGEFQRQIAIANHFAFRGEISQAQYQFNRAQNALEISYAALRGKYSWPRNPRDLAAANIPWGEARETFQDYLLCEFQLFLERGLVAHTLGRIKLDDFEGTVKMLESQMGMPIGQRETDLFRVIPFLRRVFALRSSNKHSAQLASEFGRLSDAEELSARNYWQRRFLVFRIFENLYYGNVGRSRWIIDFLQDRQKDQLDQISIALIYLRVGAYADAENLLTRAAKFAEIEQRENFQDFVAAVTILENVYAKFGRHSEVETRASSALTHLNGLKVSGEIPREDLLELRRAIQDQQFRVLTSRYLINRNCDPSVSVIPDEIVATADLRLRYRIFASLCTGSDLATILKQAETEKSLTAQSQQKLKELKLDLAFANALRAKNRQYILDNLAARVRRQIENDANLLLLEWGVANIPDQRAEIFQLMSGKADLKAVVPIFLEGHRQYLISTPLQMDLLAASDAAHYSALLAKQLFDFPTPETGKIPNPTQAILKFSDGTNSLFYDTRKKLLSTRDLETPNTKSPLLTFGTLEGFGSASVHIAPFFSYCDSCQTEPGGARLLGVSSNSDLSEVFSVVLDGKKRTCSMSSDSSEDTLVIPQSGLPGASPCDIHVERTVIEYEDTKLPPFYFTAMWRKNAIVIYIPASLNGRTKDVFLFDFFQRANRRQIAPREAFSSALERAKKSFPDEAQLNRVYLYESQ